MPWRFPRRRRIDFDVDALRSALIRDIEGLLVAQVSAVSATVIRDIEREAQAKERRRALRLLLVTLPSVLVLSVTGYIYLAARPAVAISVSTPASGFTQLGFTDPIGPQGRLARVQARYATVEPSFSGSQTASSRRVLVRLLIDPRHCPRLSRVGGYCEGAMVPKPTRPGDTLRLRWSRPTLLSLSYRHTASQFTVSRDGQSLSALLDGSLQVLNAACIAPTQLSVQRSDAAGGGGRAVLNTCPRRSGRMAWVSATYSPSEPPEITFDPADNLSIDATAVRLDAILTDATLQYDATARTISSTPPGISVNVISAPGSGRLRTRTDGSSMQTQGVASQAKVASKQIVMSRFAQQEGVWLAILGLIGSAFASICASAIAAVLRAHD